jgi:hypothetical protein
LPRAGPIGSRDREADKPGAHFAVWIETFVDEQAKDVLAQLPLASDGTDGTPVALDFC